jgi:hypothetical protein
MQIYYSRKVACYANGKEHNKIMLNLFQHQGKPAGYETLKHPPEADRGNNNRFAHQA